MPRYLIKVKGKHIDYMPMGRYKTVQQIKNKQKELGVKSSLQGYKVVTAKNTSEAVTKRLHQLKILSKDKYLVLRKNPKGRKI